MKAYDKQAYKELNTLFTGCEWISFGKNGMTLHYKGALKELMEEESITDMCGYSESEHYVRDCIPMYLDTMSYADDASFLLGLTNCPAFFVGSPIPEESDYAFAFFENYQVKDWVEELIAYGSVTFETVVNMQEVQEKTAAFPAILYVEGKQIVSTKCAFINDCSEGDSDIYTFVGCYDEHGKLIEADKISFLEVEMPHSYLKETLTPRQFEEELGYFLAIQTLKDC